MLVIVVVVHVCSIVVVVIVFAFSVFLKLDFILKFIVSIYMKHMLMVSFPICAASLIVFRLSNLPTRECDSVSQVWVRRSVTFIFDIFRTVAFLYATISLI